MIKKAILSLLLTLLAGGALACSPGDGYYAPIEQGPAPMCTFESGSAMGGPIVDLGQNRIAQQQVTFLLTASCGSGYNVVVFDCASGDLINLHMADDDMDLTEIPFDFGQWATPQMTSTFMSSAIGHRLLRAARRDRAAFIRITKNTRAHARVTQIDPKANVDPTLRCGCAHYYPDTQ
ncbi:MAG: hypothetical protein ACPGRD_01765 [Planktomarina sp.]